jgi:hypothetical protein
MKKLDFLTFNILFILKQKFFFFLMEIRFLTVSEEKKIIKFFIQSISNCINIYIYIYIYII